MSKIPQGMVPLPLVADVLTNVNSRFVEMLEGWKKTWLELAKAERELAEKAAPIDLIQAANFRGKAEAYEEMAENLAEGIDMIRGGMEIAIAEIKLGGKPVQ